MNESEKHKLLSKVVEECHLVENIEVNFNNTQVLSEDSFLTHFQGGVILWTTDNFSYVKYILSDEEAFNFSKIITEKHS